MYLMLYSILHSTDHLQSDFLYNYRYYINAHLMLYLNFTYYIQI